MFYWLVGAGILAVVAVCAAVHLGSAVDHVPAPTGNPLVLVLGLSTGNTVWPPSAGWILPGILGAVTAVALSVALGRGRRGTRKVRGDRAAQLMGTGRDIAAIRTRIHRVRRHCRLHWECQRLSALEMPLR